MSALDFAAIAAKVAAVRADVTAEKSDNGQPFLRVPAAALPVVAGFLKKDAALAFDSLMDLSAYDRLKYPATPANPASDAICVMLFLHSTKHRHKVTLEVQAPRANCAVPTVSDVWAVANYFEREVFDLFGVTFTGHPNLRRIMTPQDWVGHPLRKDYIYPADYHGIAHLREGQHFGDAPRRVGDPEPTPAATPAKGGHA